MKRIGSPLSSNKLKRTKEVDELSELLFYTTELLHDIIQLIILYLGGRKGWGDLKSICTFVGNRTDGRPIPKLLNIGSTFVWFMFYRQLNTIDIVDIRMEIIDSISTPLAGYPIFSPFRTSIADGIYASWLMYDDRLCLVFGLKSDTGDYYSRFRDVRSEMGVDFSSYHCYMYSFDDKCIITKDNTTFSIYLFNGSSIVFVCKFELETDNSYEILEDQDSIISINDSKIYKVNISLHDYCDITEYDITSGRLLYKYKIKYRSIFDVRNFCVTETAIGPHFMVQILDFVSDRTRFIETLADRTTYKHKRRSPRMISFSGHNDGDDVDMKDSYNNSIILSVFNKAKGRYGLEMLSICIDQKKDVVPAIEFHDAEP
jgi:hypothetical protein